MLLLAAAAAAAAQVSAPASTTAKPQWSFLQPINYGDWWTSVQFPERQIKTVLQTREVRLRVIVRPDGKPRNCELEKSSGDKKVDEYTCAVALMKGKYLPARWLDGSPSYGVDRTPITWTLRQSRLRSVADMQLSVNQLPAGVKSPVTVAIAFAADERGRPVACAERPKWDPRQERANEALIEVACQELIASFIAKPALNDEGRPVHSVQNASVEFIIRK